MNIWILNHYAITPDKPGGTRHFDFARELVKRGHKVFIFASSFSHRVRKDNKLNRREKYKRENVEEVVFYWVKTPPYYGGNDWRRVLNMLSYFHSVILLGMKLKEKPDVILASSPHLFTGLAGCILAKLKRTHFIFEIRDLWPQTLVEIGGYSNSSTIVKLLRILEKFLYHKAEKIIVLLPMAETYITNLGIPRKRIIWIPNGISPDRLSISETKLPDELKKTISKLRDSKLITIGYTGAHGITNTLEIILSTAKILQNKNFNKAHFLLVGDGPQKKDLIQKAKSFELENITFSEAIPKNIMPELLKAIDIAVISGKKTDLYKYGVSPNKLWDYMAGARPVVWAINSANDPVAEAGCGITVEPEDPEAMAQAIMKLSNLSATERQKLGKKGYEYVMKHHSVPVLVDRLLEVLGDA